MQRTLSELAAPFARERVLITGGLGFLGSSLARALASAAARVTVVDALVPGHGGLRFNLEDTPDVAIEVGDVRDERLMRRLVADQDVVFSLSGQTSHLDSMRDPYTDLEHNCRGPMALLEACRHTAPEAKIVFASTRQLYGRPRYLPVDEAHPVDPVDVNGIHKFAAEHYHLLYHRVYGLPVSVLRLTNSYGPRMRVRDARQTFLGVWVRRILSGEPLEIWGDGQQRRDFNYVDDVLRAFLMVARQSRTDGAVFNLGGSNAVSLSELADLLVTLHGSGDWRLVPYPSDRKPIDIGDYYADYSRIRESVGWEPIVSLRHGLAETLAYFRAHGPRYWSHPK